MQQRQDRIVETVLSEAHIDRLARRRHWRSPLALRTGLWSPGPPNRKAGSPAGVIGEVVQQATP